MMHGQKNIKQKCYSVLNGRHSDVLLKTIKIYKYRQNTTKFIILYHFWTTCFDSLESSSGPLVQRFSNFFQAGTTFISQECSADHPTLGIIKLIRPKQCSKHVFATENPSFVAEGRVGTVVNFIKCQSWERKFKDTCM